MAYGRSQARGRNGAAAASLGHSHSNARSEPCLLFHDSSWQRWMLNPLSEARDQTCSLTDTSRVCNLQSHSWKSSLLLFYKNVC